MIYKCDKCDGTGIIEVEKLDGWTIMDTCPKCKGYKELNWIERIFGRNGNKYSHNEWEDRYDNL